MGISFISLDYEGTNFFERARASLDCILNVSTPRWPGKLDYRLWYYDLSVSVIPTDKPNEIMIDIQKWGLKNSTYDLVYDVEISLNRLIRIIKEEEETKRRIQT